MPQLSPGPLVVTEVFPPQVGGSGVLFANVYSRFGGGVTVLTDGSGPSATSPATGLRVVRRPIAWKRWGIVHPAAIMHHRRVGAEIKRLRAPGTIVHCGRALPEGLATLLASSLRRLPYLCWAHGEEIQYALSSRELSFVIRRVYRGARAVIANSGSTAEMLRACDVPSAKIHVVHPGVDSSAFNPAVDGSGIRQRFVSGSELLLLSVGRLQRRKGHDQVIAAIAQLRPSHPHLRYVVAGDGEERPRLQQLAEQLGVTDRVWFTGSISDRELPAFYAACDIFVMPNRVDAGDVEGFGIVFLEAAAAGRPVIGGRSGGVRDAVAEGRTGLLVSGTDVHELASGIRRLAESEEMRRAMGAAGRDRVVKEFSWDRAATIVRALHEEIADDHDGLVGGGLATTSRYS